MTLYKSYYVLFTTLFTLVINTPGKVSGETTAGCSNVIIVNWWDRAPYVYDLGSEEEILYSSTERSTIPPTTGRPTTPARPSTPKTTNTSPNATSSKTGAPKAASGADPQTGAPRTNAARTGAPQSSAPKTASLNNTDNGNTSSTARPPVGASTGATTTTKQTATLTKMEMIKTRKVTGVLKLILEMLVKDCCGSGVKFVYRNSSKNVVDMRVGANSAVINYPVNGERTTTHFKGYPYIPLIEPPAIVFLTKLPGKSDTAKHVITTAFGGIYILIPGLILAVIAGILMWMLDSYINYDEFPKTFFQGIWKGFWWSVVTMTTVGYGDKVPKSVFARALAIVWAYMGTVIYILFQSKVTSSLTANALDPDLSLHGKTIVAFNNSEERSFGIQSNAKVIDVETINEFAGKIINDGNIKGGIIDSYVAGHYQNVLSEDKGFFTKNIYDYQFMYGVALSNAFRNKPMEKCLRRAAVLRESEIRKILSEDLPPLPTPDTAKFQKLTTSVFASGSSIFQETAATCAVIMAVIMVLGFIWQFMYRPNTRPCCRGQVEPLEDEELKYVSELNLYDNEDDMFKGQLRELEDAMVQEVLLYRRAFQKRKQDMYKLINCEGLVKQLPFIMAIDEIHFAKYSSPNLRD